MGVKRGNLYVEQGKKGDELFVLKQKAGAHPAPHNLG